MNKIDKFIRTYLIYTGPVIFPLFIYTFYFEDGGNLHYPKLLNNFLGFLFIFWLLGFIYFLLRLLINPQMRRVLSANTRELI